MYNILGIAVVLNRFLAPVNMQARSEPKHQDCALYNFPGGPWSVVM